MDCPCQLEFEFALDPTESPESSSYQTLITDSDKSGGLPTIFPLDFRCPVLWKPAIKVYGLNIVLTTRNSHDYGDHLG